MSEIITVLNVYRRTKNLQEQVDSIRNQTIKSKIWIWVNYHEDNFGHNYDKYKVDCVINSSINFKYHGRFTCGLLAKSDFLAYFDDDTIPGNRWFENCLSTIELAEKNNFENPILGSAGVVLHSPKYQYHTRVGWPSMNDKPTIVDLVGHAWFFKKSTLKYLWYEDPISLENGEDIQLSYLVNKYAKGGITICPPHPRDDICMWGSTKANELGIDSVASSNNNFISHDTFFKQRDEIIAQAIQKGWCPLFMKK
jgi:hypothetical protein